MQIVRNNNNKKQWPTQIEPAKEPKLALILLLLFYEEITVPTVCALHNLGKKFNISKNWWYLDNTQVKLEENGNKIYARIRSWEEKVKLALFWF